MNSVAVSAAQEQQPAAILALVTPKMASYLDDLDSPEERFIDLLDVQFGLGRSDWDAIRRAIETAKLTSNDSEDEGLGPVTPFMFLSTIPAAREHFYEIVKLALEAGLLTEDDLPETVLLDDPDVRITIRGCALPNEWGGWTVGGLKLVIESRLDARAVPLVRPVWLNNEYLMTNRFPIRTNLPGLYEKLDRHGLFAGHGKTTKGILLHRLVAAAGGLDVAGMDVDHRLGSSGRWYGGLSTFDAHFSSLQALEPDAHREVTLRRDERNHHYTREARAAGSPASGDGRDPAGGAPGTPPT